MSLSVRPERLTGLRLALFRSRALLALVWLGGARSTAPKAWGGDLLRGGYSNSTSQTANPTSFTPPSASQARANAQDALARATQAMQAVRQMQSSARAIAAGKTSLGINPNNPSAQLPTVPNGLGLGGLQPAAGATAGSSLWSGAKMPTETSAKGQTVVTVDQTSSQAVLTWQSFNIGHSTTLKFDQSAGGSEVGNWVVFNVVEDPSGVPSQILGSIKAAGQVYVINQNGIIFGGASEVNVHALVASSLPINNYLIGVGLVNNPDDQYLFSSLTIPALAMNPTAPTFTPPAAPNGKSGDVTVEAGAVLESPADADGVGGKIALIGPNVTNAGTILTPDGQTILAAGQQVGFLPHAESDPSLRGLDVFIGQGGGTAINEGEIIAPEADVTIMGATVEQMGGIESTTSVSLNGRIDLDANWGTGVVQVNGANELVTTEAGNVIFGPNSITDILPEIDSSAMITSASPPPNQALALQSQVNVQGETIHMEGNAELLAPNANVTMQAGTWQPVGSAGFYGFEFTKGQIYLDSGALMDVAGSEDVDASVSQNIVAVQLLGPELADSPLQRGSVLEGQTIYVDIRDQGVYDGQEWIGTPLADAYGYAGLVQYTAGELTTAGGNVTMKAGGSVVMQQGSEVNVSAGWIDYTGGVVTTSELISGGHIYPIDEATPDLVYSGFLPQYTLNAPKWGVSETYNDPLITDSHYENGYLYGGAGGTVNITAPATALDGKLLGLTENGPRQVGPDAVQAVPSALTIAFEGQYADNGIYQVYAPTPPAVVFSTQDDLPAGAPFSVDLNGDPAALSAARTDKVILSPDLFTTNGFGDLTVRNGDGSITVPAGVTLDAGVSGAVDLIAANMDIEGSIIAPGGSIDLTVYDYSPYQFTIVSNDGSVTSTPPANPSRGNFVLGSGAVLDVAGLEIDDRDRSPVAGTLPEVTAGGTVKIASYNADLEAGSVINASGGVELNTAGAPTYGVGGSISVLAGADPEIDSMLGGHLELDGEMTAYSGVRGGSLAIEAPQIQVGGAALGGDVLTLQPGFFDQGGFGSFTLESIHNLVVEPGTLLDPVAESLVALPSSLQSGGLQTTTALLPVSSRTPVSLTFDAVGAIDIFNQNTQLFTSSFVLGAGAEIRTDPLGTITINANLGTVSILGSIFAHGGAITISAGDTVAGYNDQRPSEALPTIYISPQSVLSAAGTVIYTPNSYGYVTGSVTPGGSISLSGNILAETGAVLDVSGASAPLDESPIYLNATLGLNGATLNEVDETPVNGSFHGAILTPVLVESNGGSISLKGTEELFTDATLIGQGGGGQALGGTLSVSSGFFNPNGAAVLPSQIQLVITESGPVIKSQTGIGREVVGANDEAGLLDQGGHIAVQSFAGGGFDTINLNASSGAVDFLGDVSITAGYSISVADAGYLAANGKVGLTAPYITLGMPFEAPTPADQVVANPNPVPPTWGTGSLTVTGQLIDIGDLSLQGIGKLVLIADVGDIQGDGTLDVAGSIYLRAAQIYPPTETSFTIAAYNYTDAKGNEEDGSVTIAASGVAQLPLSAGGVLNIYAADITQDGVLRAPCGTINLGWGGAGSAPQDWLAGTSVDAASSVTLGKGSVTSVSAIDPITGQGVTIPYGLVLNGVSWIDPSGVDITTIGALQKAINISAQNVTEAHGAKIDIRGGGDLFAYDFVTGNDGDIDILDTNSSYAIVPGYAANYAPYAPFNPDRPQNSTELANLGTDPGYLNNTLELGEEIYLNASSGLSAGTYTLLPARYTVLPGAYLVTPTGGAVGGNGVQPNGSTIVSGYTIGTGQPVTRNFVVETPAVVAQQAEYDTYSGTVFLGNNSTARTPADSGQLILQATEGMNLAGSVLSRPLNPNAQGGLVDIESSPSETIFIAGPTETVSPGSGDLVLSSAQLSTIGAQTLLIGGYANGTALNVETDNIVVDNQGVSLTGGDIILVANDSVTLDQGASVTALGSADHLTLTLTGNGALLRVSADVGAQIMRTGVTSTAAPASLTVGADATVSGASVILDSSQTSQLDSSANLEAKSLALDSGLISVVLSAGNGAQPGGLALSGNALEQIQDHSSSLTLLSYTSIDIYGTGSLGTSMAAGDLTLTANEIRGFDQGGGTATFNAQTITLNGESAAPQTTQAADGTLVFNGEVIHLGGSGLAIDPNVTLNGAGGIMANNSGAMVDLVTGGNLAMNAPVITGVAGAHATISAAGTVAVTATKGSAKISGGLAASLAIAGQTIEDNGDIALPSGTITLTANGGDLNIGDAAIAELSVKGSVKDIFDLTEATGGGTINLNASAGNITLGSDGTIDVSGANNSVNAGTLNVNVPNGKFVSNGTLIAKGGNGGSFSLDVQSLSSVDSLDSMLNAAGFTRALRIDVASGDVSFAGSVDASEFDLSADSGSITVSGLIDVSGETGGEITLAAAGSVTLENGAVLNASGQQFNDAGQGGSVTLSAGADIKGSASTAGLVDVQAGSTINLSVTTNNANSQSLGDFAGILLICAPETAAGTDVQVSPINGTVTGASAVVVEGCRIYEPAGGQITSALETEIYNDGVNFLGADGVTTANYTAMLNRITGNSGLTIYLEDGAEIINPSGNLTLGTSTATTSADWNLASDRFGPDGTAGQLTLRASGNLVFYNSLSDGFASGMYNASLLAQNTALPANIQSWNYTLTAGSNFGSANTSGVIVGNGSIELGRNDPTPYANGSGSSGPGSGTLTSAILYPENGEEDFYEVIRTGGGSINVSAGANVELLNQFASIYTAGTQLTTAETTMNGDFVVPDPTYSIANQGASVLGTLPITTLYPVQYSDAGGDVTIDAGGGIEHLTQNAQGQLIEDSELELPNNWLYRRDYYVTNASGQLVSGLARYKDNASTTWWVDFSNFFEGVGALGGGNVTLTAGGNVANVDAVAPTNGRMPEGTPSAAALVELGGGDVTVTAGNNIDAGVYYVERGQGTLTAGNEIMTNSTRSPSLGGIVLPVQVDSSETWLPTTLFLGQGDFSVTAGGSLLLGPVANVFTMPEGMDNTFWYKTYFSTYASTDAVDVTSLAGSVTLREEITPDGGSSPEPILQAWMNDVDLQSNSIAVSNYQPWLRLDEADVEEFTTLASLLPPTLRVNALSGDIDVGGDLTLVPSPTGTLVLAAGGSINAEQPNGGAVSYNGSTAIGWDSSMIIVSDAPLDSLPGVTDPLAFQSTPGATVAGIADQSGISLAGLLQPITDAFAQALENSDENLQTKQEFHGESTTGGPLHTGNNPVELYAQAGSISGLTLYSPEETRVIAGRDITDISFYLQNDMAGQVSVVSAGGDIIAYDPDSVLRTDAQLSGNVLETTESQEGDIQISGPGTLEVLAGNDLNLGVGPNGSSPGVGVGITSIGNLRNPYLPEQGADVIAAAGVGPITDLSGSQLDFTSFINQFVTGPLGATYLAELSTMAAGLPSFSGAGGFNKLSPEERDMIALDVFYLVLRDAGRDHNLAGSPGYGNYDAGYQAIADLIPDSHSGGDISLTSREIATENGGNISIFDPSGPLTVGYDIAGNQPLDQGIFTEDGGNISIFTDGSIIVGTSRIFTLRGGNEVLWSTAGNIAAGESPKTVQEAPPTQVIVDPQSANVQTDLGGLATGGGIGVLASVQGVPAGNVDLIAPTGTVDAGDAGIRVTGNLNIAAARVLNISNIQVGGVSTGVPVTVVAVPNVAGLTAAANSAGAGAAAAGQLTASARSSADEDDAPSLVTVQVIGYGGPDED